MLCVSNSVHVHKVGGRETFAFCVAAVTGLYTYPLTCVTQAYVRYLLLTCGWIFDHVTMRGLPITWCHDAEKVRDSCIT